MHDSGVDPVFREGVTFERAQTTTSVITVVMSQRFGRGLKAVLPRRKEIPKRRGSSTPATRPSGRPRASHGSGTAPGGSAGRRAPEASLCTLRRFTTKVECRRHAANQAVEESHENP